MALVLGCTAFMMQRVGIQESGFELFFRENVHFYGGWAAAEVNSSTSQGLPNGACGLFSTLGYYVRYKFGDG